MPLPDTTSKPLWVSKLALLGGLIVAITSIVVAEPISRCVAKGAPNMSSCINYLTGENFVSTGSAIRLFLVGPSYEQTDEDADYALYMHVSERRWWSGVTLCRAANAMMRTQHKTALVQRGGTNQRCRFAFASAGLSPFALYPSLFLFCPGREHLILFRGCQRRHHTVRARVGHVAAPGSNGQWQGQGQEGCRCYIARQWWFFKKGEI